MNGKIQPQTNIHFRDHVITYYRVTNGYTLGVWAEIEARTHARLWEMMQTVYRPMWGQWNRS